MLMKDHHRVILEFPLEPRFEAEILQCFADEGQYLLFPYYGLDYNEPDAQICEYIKRRTVYIENNYAYWFHPGTLADVEAVVRTDPTCYRCMVVAGQDDEVCIRYRLEVFEHYEYVNQETRALIVTESEDGDYYSHTAPKIREAARRYGSSVRSEESGG